MACGCSRRKAARLAGQPDPEPIILGAQGLFKIRYMGDLNGKWRGAETCHMYEFTTVEPVRYVDKRDVPAFLTVLQEAGTPMFVEAGEWLRLQS